MKDYEKKIRTQEKLRMAVLLIATAIILAGITVRERLPWLIYLAAAPLAVMVVNTLLIRHYEKKQREQEK